MKYMSARKSLLSLVATALLLCLTAGSAMSGSMPETLELNGIEPEVAESIVDYCKREMVERHAPGLAVGIVKGKKLIFEAYLGRADIDKRKPVDEGTIFRIGSISKTMTSVGLMQQYERGKFKLDDNINDYLPEKYVYPPHPEEKPVTFIHLFTHTSGIGEFLSYRQVFLKNLGLQVEGDNYMPIRHYLRWKAHPEFDPGKKWAYSNYGYTMLGLALQTIAGEPFHIHMEKSVFEPLGMHTTTYQHDDEILERLATGYKYEDGGYVIDPHKAFGITPSGNVYTTVGEMALYVQALLNGGKNENGRVLEPETVKLIMKTHYTLDPRQQGRGLGFLIYGNDMWGHRILGHGGHVPWGFSAQLLLAPEENLGVFLFSNSGERMPYETAWGVLKKMLGVEDKPLPEVEPDREVWPELTGFYGPEYRQLKTNVRLYFFGVGAYRVREIDGELMLVHTWKGEDRALRLLQVQPDDPYFYRLETPDSEYPHYVSFKRGESGRMYIIPEGQTRYIKLGFIRRFKARLLAVPGRLFTSE